MKFFAQISAICVLTVVSACQPNVTVPSVTTPTSTTPPTAATSSAQSIAAVATQTTKSELRIDDIRALVNLKNYGSALDAVNEFINRQPANADALYLRAKIQSAIGDFPAATVSIEQSLQAGLSNPNEVLTDAALVEYRKSPSFKQLQTKYSALAVHSEKLKTKRVVDDPLVVKAGNITLRLPSN